MKIIICVLSDCVSCDVLFSQTIAQTLSCSLEALLLLKWSQLEQLYEKYGQKALKCAQCPAEFSKPKALAIHCAEDHGLDGCLDLPRLEDSFWPSTGVWHVCDVKGANWGIYLFLLYTLISKR